MKSNMKEVRGSYVLSLIVVASFLFLFVPLHRAAADEDLNHLYTLWTQGQYRDVATGAIEYMRKPYGKSPVAFYLLASSLCRIPEYQDQSKKYFLLMLNRFSLDLKSREQVEKEMRECSPANEKKPAQIIFITQRTGGGVAGVKGKMYYWLDSENSPLVSDPAEIIRTIPAEEFKARLFEVSKATDARRALSKRVGNKFLIESSAHFIVASSSRHTHDQLKNMLRGLETYLKFYVANFNMPEPPYLITVYLVPETEDLRKLAEKLHGIRMGESSIGYSFQEDLSITGVIPKTTYGTLNHELFHLMVHNNFGDIPPWMEEGMAALYEVSRIEGDKIIGLPNWRGEVLKRFWGLRPDVGTLVRMDWRSFDNAERDFEAKKQATNHAMARYFMLYLQNKNNLRDVYNAFREREVDKMLRNPAEDSVKLIEKILKMEVGEIDAKFAQWFRE